MDAGPPKSMAPVGKAVMSPQMHFQSFGLLFLLSLLLRPMPCFIFLLFLLPSPSCFFEAIRFFKVYNSSPPKAHSNITAMATLGFLHFSLCMKSRKLLKGRARMKRRRGQCGPTPVGASWEKTEANKKGSG